MIMVQHRRNRTMTVDLYQPIKDRDTAPVDEMFGASLEFSVGVVGPQDSEKSFNQLAFIVRVLPQMISISTTHR